MAKINNINILNCREKIKDYIDAHISYIESLGYSKGQARKILAYAISRRVVDNEIRDTIDMGLGISEETRN